MSRQRVCRIDVWVYRVALRAPVATSFGVMKDRPAVFLRLEDSDGAYGFGEIWCNFPAHGAEHRARLLIDELAAIVFALDASEPASIFARLSALTHVRALQTGEPGPYAQVIAGLDIAGWDLKARAAAKPVRALLNDAAPDAVPAYASGIHIRHAEKTVAACRAQGHRAFKVKVGFDLADDCARLKQLAGALGTQERLFADANQAWDIDAAVRFVSSLDDAPVGWLEEPLAADAPQSDWERLGAVSAVPLAAGENLVGKGAFERMIASGSIAYIQPDIAKWGGFTGCLEVARTARQAGRTYCPHYLGGGIGLLASANLLAAAGGNGLLEVDVNPNPLRDAFLDEGQLRPDGQFRLPPKPGLGVDALPDALDPHEILHETVTA
ncbi:MAG: mandelate racemase/muconate lactonizing enzyme family protein [Hyphomicrobiales bacterium]|nr:mandelate racemase/muconate lactonizing enzyme family protein [Hyphomicrobiales bacterium]